MKKKQGSGSSGKNEFAHAFLGWGLSDSDNNWYLDLGALHHMTNRKDWLENYAEDSVVKVSLGDDSVVQAKGSGTVRILLKVPRGVSEGILENVLYVLEIAKNLLSVLQATKKGTKFTFEGEKCYMKNGSDELVGMAMLTNDLY